MPNREPWLAEKGRWTGQYWKITHVYDDWYRLTTYWQGDEKSLDIRNDGINTHVWLADSGNYSGQLWKFTKILALTPESPLPYPGYSYRLTTLWRGPEFSLDTVGSPNPNTGIILKPTD